MLHAHHIQRPRSRHFLKARSTKYGFAMRRFEGNRCLQATLSADCARLWTRSLRSTGAVRLALLAVFRVVRKQFVVKEKLLTCRKHKLGPAVDAGQLFVNKIHATSPLQNFQRQNAAS
jgi:hypothetical protein